MTSSLTMCHHTFIDAPPTVALDEAAQLHQLALLDAAEQEEDTMDQMHALCQPMSTDNHDVCGHCGGKCQMQLPLICHILIKFGRADGPTDTKTVRRIKDGEWSSSLVKWGQVNE